MEEERYQGYRHESSENCRRVLLVQQGEDGVYRCEASEAPEKNRKQPHGFRILSLVLSAALIISLFSLVQQSKELKELKERNTQSGHIQGVAEVSAQAETASLKNLSVEQAAMRKSEGGKTALSIQEIAKRCKPYVVAISTEQSVSNGFGYATLPVAGSGFFISEDGYIATNNHVVEAAKEIKVHTNDGKLYDAKLIGSDPLSDLAVIKVEPKDGEKFSYAAFGDSDSLEVGELAVAIGNPAGTLEGSVTAGIISSLQRTIEVGGLEMNLLQTDAAINSGNSGGALINSFGEVIGINTAKLSSNGRTTFDGIAFAIPSNYARPVLQDLMQHGKVTNRVQIGIYGQSLNEEYARFFKLADRPGILIERVIKGSSADDAGLQSGDFITEINGHAVDSMSSVNNLKREMKVGDVVHLVYFREGKRLEADMTMKAEMPDPDAPQQQNTDNGAEPNPNEEEVPGDSAEGEMPLNNPSGDVAP